MDCLTTFPLLLLLSLITSTSAVNFEVRNNCPYTVWAAATPVGGGQRLDNGQSWNINVPRGTAMARIWGRRNCNFDGSGRGSCETGDCNGVLQCTGWGKAPNTLAEFALNQFNNLDFFDISNIDGFNIPMSFGPTTPGPDKCHQVSCTADIVGQCLGPLRIIQGFSRAYALMLIVILRMMKPAFSLALETPLIIGLSSAHDQINQLRICGSVNAL
nr:osmotin-like protein [Ipomoea batatas]